METLTPKDENEKNGIFIENHFRGQEKGERILQIIRRHWFNIAVQYIPIFFMLVAWGALLTLLPQYASEIIGGNFAFFMFAMTAFLMFIWVYAAIIWVDYYLDVWIITNRRVVNVEQKGLFVRQVSELRYRNVQDVSTHVNGIFPTFLKFGNVVIQTAGTQPMFEFRSVPQPYAIQASIIDLQKKSRRNDMATMEEMIMGPQI